MCWSRALSKGVSRGSRTRSRESRHDNYVVKDSSVLDGVEPLDYIGDKGFVGNSMITLFKKPAGGELLDWQKKFNRQVNKIRWIIEQAIANFKTWRITHTDYRRPIENVRGNHHRCDEPGILQNGANNPLFIIAQGRQQRHLSNYPMARTAMFGKTELPHPRQGHPVTSVAARGGTGIPRRLLQDAFAMRIYSQSYLGGSDSRQAQHADCPVRSRRTRRGGAR